MRWYSATGEVESETDKLISHQSPFGFFFTSGPAGQEELHGMYGDWHFKSPDEDISVLASPNGRTLVRFVRGRHHTEAIEVYVMGKRTFTAGSVRASQLVHVSIGDDGSVGALFMSNRSETEAFVTNARGTLSMRIPAPGASAIQAGPDGQCAILWKSNAALEYVTAQGQRTEVLPSISFASSFAHWLPGSVRVLLASKREQKHVLFDLAEQRIVWEVKAPTYPDPLYAVPFGQYVFQSDLQPSPTEKEPEASVRLVRALDILTGDVRATWTSSPPKQYSGRDDVGKLMVRDGRLYFVTDDEFSEVSPNGCWVQENGK